MRSPERTIRKLILKSEDEAASPAEAAIFLSKAHKLMDKYSITEDMLPDDNEVIRVRVLSIPSTEHLSPAIEFCIKAICLYFGKSVLVDVFRDGRELFIAGPGSVQTKDQVIALYLELLQSCSSFFSAEFTTSIDKWTSIEQRRGFMIGWIIGFCGMDSQEKSGKNGSTFVYDNETLRMGIEHGIAYQKTKTDEFVNAA